MNTIRLKICLITQTQQHICFSRLAKKQTRIELMVINSSTSKIITPT